MQVLKLRDRSSRGASTIVLVMTLAFFVLLPLALLGFEMSRAFLCQQELHNVCDSAALSGSAAMASAPETDPNPPHLPTTYAQRQQFAMTTAFQTFQYNSILQTPLNGAGTVTPIYNPNSPVAATPPVHQCVINLILKDQNGNQVPTTNPGTPAASMTCMAYWTDAPVWAGWGWLPLGQYTLQAGSNGGLPLLDIIVCMDVSGSMDDQTPIRFVNRYWDVTTTPGHGQIGYNTNVMSGSNPGYPSGSNTSMYSILGLNSSGEYTGTALNAYPPQNLSDATYQGAGLNNFEFDWSETPNAGIFHYSNLQGLRSNTTITAFKTATMPEAGMPPGNCNPANPNVSTNLPVAGEGNNPHLQDGVGGFTDMIVDSIIGQTFSGYTFTDAATAVEASRGNMENAAVFKSACGWTPSNGVVVPATRLAAVSPGFFGAYWEYVLQNAQPMSSARLALYDFYNTMNVSSNCHLGLVCFSTTIGSNATSVWSGTDSTANLVDASYAAGGTGTFPNPLISLAGQAGTSTAAQQLLDFTNVTQADQGVPCPTLGQQPTWNPTSGWLVPPAQTPPLRASGATDIEDALAEGISELTNAADYRTTAKKAIVLFTDGVPNIPGGFGPASTNTLNYVTANDGNTVNIPIYTIGLADASNPTLITLENGLLNDNSGGIAAISGNQAFYVPVANSAQLDQGFQRIARALCELQF